MSNTPVPRPCLELGVCQNRKPLCDDCVERPTRLAPGVIEGPYRRQSTGKGLVMQAKHVLREMAAYLMRPYP
jgi:hypothetical protein